MRNFDIWVDGMGGQQVRAARTGELTWKSDLGGGMVTIEVTLPGGTKEWDTYLHLQNIVAPDENANDRTVEQGEGIGEISTTAYPAGERHLHFQVTSTRPPRDEVED